MSCCWAELHAPPAWRAYTTRLSRVPKEKVLAPGAEAMNEASARSAKRRWQTCMFARNRFTQATAPARP